MASLVEGGMDGNGLQTDLAVIWELALIIMWVEGGSRLVCVMPVGDRSFRIYRMLQVAGTDWKSYAEPVGDRRWLSGCGGRFEWYPGLLLRASQVPLLTSSSGRRCCLRALGSIVEPSKRVSFEKTSSVR